MPTDISLEEGERLIADLLFVVPKGASSFQITVTDRALFLRRKKFVAVRDPTYFERVPLNRVIEARVKRLSPFFLWVLALLMVIGGSVSTVLMLLPIVRGEGGQLSGYPPAVAIVGLVIPFVAKRRYGLAISIVDEAYLWKPPIHVDRASRNALDVFLTQTADALRRAGINVRDERDSVPATANGVSSASDYPLAKAGDSEDTRGVLRACYRCGSPLRISRWEDWNRFLFRCPHCQGINGKPWRPDAILFGSLLLNVLSFFLTSRWKRALSLFLAFVPLDVFLLWGLDRVQLPQAVELVLAAVALLGPLTINAVLLLRHEMALNAALAISAKPRS